MDNFDLCLAFTLREEGGYTDDPADPGNWTGGAPGQGALRGTNFGISAAAYPTLDIRNLTADAAAAIYRQDYWSKLQGDALAMPVALVTFDAAVNAGVHRAATWLQQALGVVADGIIGPSTLIALAAADAGAVAQEALVRRLAFLTGLPGWARFGLGWTRRVIALAARLTA
jgi:lysozyme family protein